MLAQALATTPAPSTTSKSYQANSIEELRRGVAALAPELFGRALRMSRSSALAEDLVQDTVERALRFETQSGRAVQQPAAA